MEGLTDIVGITAAVCGLIGVIITAFAFLGQTSISITLMTHEQREKYRLAQKIIVYVGLFAFSFGVGMALDVDFLNPGSIIEKGGECFPIIALAVVAAILSLIFMLLFARRDKKSNNTHNFFHYLFSFALLFTGIFALVLNVIFSNMASGTEALRINVVLSFAFLVFMWMLVNLRGLGKEDEVAYLKTQCGEEELFLFEMKGDYLVAGDKRCLTECSYFRLIKVSEMKEPLESVRGGEE